MINTVISSYEDKDYLSIDLEVGGIEFANVNIENKVIKIDIYKVAENFTLDLQELMSKLQYAKEELVKTYPEFNL